MRKTVLQRSPLDRQREKRRDGKRGTTTQIGSEGRRGCTWTRVCLSIHAYMYRTVTHIYRVTWCKKKREQKKGGVASWFSGGVEKRGWHRIGIHGRWKCNNKHYLSAREPLTMRIRREKRLAAAQKRKFFAIKSFRGIWVMGNSCGMRERPVTHIQRHRGTW